MKIDAQCVQLPGTYLYNVYNGLTAVSVQGVTWCHSSGTMELKTTYVKILGHIGIQPKFQLSGASESKMVT